MEFYGSLIYKDIAFYDDFKTGDMLSRLQSDTQVVQDGLSSNVAMFFKAATIWAGTIVILFTYDVRLALIILAVVAPQIVAQRLSFHYLQAFTTRYQKAKTIMS